MTTPISTRSFDAIDVAAIDAQARAMRAEMMRTMFRAVRTWLAGRRPATLPVGARRAAA